MPVVQPMPSVREHKESVCAHERTKKVRRVYANGTETCWSQCQVCGSALRAIPKKDVLNIYVLPLFDEEIARAWTDRLAQERAERAQARRGEWFESYNRYLESAEWRRLRERVFERAGGICEGCRTQPVSEVHHMTYDRVGHEMLFDLVGVCSGCHRKITRWAREKK